MARWLDPDDFKNLHDPHRLVDEVEALAVVAAPCLLSLDAEGEFYAVQVAALRAILRSTIKRWAGSVDDSSSAVTLSAGPFSQTVEPGSKRNNLWPSEIKDLQKICRLDDSATGKAWSVDRLPGGHGDVHADICSRWFGDAHCSCMADINPEHTSLYPAEHHAGHRAHMRPL